MATSRRCQRQCKRCRRRGCALPTSALLRRKGPGSGASQSIPDVFSEPQEPKASKVESLATVLSRAVASVVSRTERRRLRSNPWRRGVRLTEPRVPESKNGAPGDREHRESRCMARGKQVATPPRPASARTAHSGRYLLAADRPV